MLLILHLIYIHKINHLKITQKELYFLNNHDVPAYINTSGLKLLDVNGNYNNIDSYFAHTGNSLLVCGDKTAIDHNRKLNV